MDTYLTITEASQVTRISEQVLKQLASNGKIRSTMLATSGVILLNERDVRSRISIKNRPEYQKFEHLAGSLISLSEAERRYGVLQSTISRWIKKEFINRAGNAGRAVLVNEAEVATYCEIYKSSGGHQGSWVFDRDGNLYSKRN